MHNCAIRYDLYIKNHVTEECNFMDKSTLKEKQVHKTDNLEMNVYETGYDIMYHWHDEYEFIYVTDGRCNCIINGEYITINKNELLLIQCGELHTVNVDATAQFFAIVIHPHLCGSECVKYFSNNINFNRIFTTHNPIESKILKDIKKIYHCFKNKHFAYELRLKSLITDIFSNIFENNLYSKKADTESDTFSSFEKIIEYIHTNYLEKITLNMLTDYSNYSKTYIIRLFKKYTGKTPIDYINRYRIYKAQELLQNTDKSVLNVSLECGFDNLGYFIRLFKQHLGTTPRQFRKGLNS